MSKRVGLWLGDSFAEAVVAESNDSEITSHSPKRWFLPKKNLADGLREVLANSGSPNDAVTGGEIVLTSSRDEGILARRQGGPIACLVTQGFESWVKSAPHPSAGVLKPAPVPGRTSLPLSSDHIFGLEERLNADGSIEKALKEEELEVLVAKLELLKVKDIAVGLLHSRKNPAHELLAEKFFTEKGFRVFVSHKRNAAPEGSGNEVLNWRRAIDKAYVNSANLEFEAEIQKACEGSAWTVRHMGADDALIAAFEVAKKKGASLAMYFGLEEFSWIGSEREDGKLRVGRLPVQPTTQIAVTDWAFPTWTTVDRGYEPGPMMWGKSHHLTWLDALMVNGRFKASIDEFSERIAEKSRARILETLATLGKDLLEPGRRSVDALGIAADLELMGVERLSSVIEMIAPPSASGKNSGQAPVELWGPLASVLAPLIAARRPDLEFRVNTDRSIAGAALI